MVTMTMLTMTMVTMTMVLMTMVKMAMAMVTMVMVTNDNSDDDLFWRGGEHIPSQQMEISRLL